MNRPSHFIEGQSSRTLSGNSEQLLAEILASDSNYDGLSEELVLMNSNLNVLQIGPLRFNDACFRKMRELLPLSTY